MTRSVFARWKSTLAASYKLLIEHSAFERQANRPVDQERPPLSHTDQLVCAVGTVEDAAASFDRLRECQKSASRQLNAAEYTLQELVAELVSMIPALASVTEPQNKSLTGAELIGAESEPVAAEEDDALAA